jgi:tetratricopeptide (TPR) repeat protein
MRKPGRNDPCRCGSGKKYKRCCLSLDEANDPFRRVLNTNPRHPEGLHALGLTALQSGRIDSAIELFTRAIEGNAAEPAYHSNLGLAYQAAGRIGEAEASYRRALALKPDFAPASPDFSHRLTQ